MVEEARVGSAEEACLNHLRRSQRLKSETLRTVIHILSRCYEDPRASQMKPSGPEAGGDSNTHCTIGDDIQGAKFNDKREICVQDETGDLAPLKIDVMENLTHEVKDSQLQDGTQMNFSVADIENMIMDIDVIGEQFHADIVNEDCLRKVQYDHLETAGFGQCPAVTLQHEDDFSTFVEFDFGKDEAAQCGGGDDKCSLSRKYMVAQSQQLDDPNNSQMYVYRMDRSDDIEEGEIDKVNAHVQSHVSQENNTEILQQSVSGANEQNNVDQSKPREELSCSEPVPVNTSAAEVDGRLITVARDVLSPNVARKPVFYGDISEETIPNAQGTPKVDDIIEKKRKRGGNSKEKRKLQKRKKRAEMDKKLGVKRMKLPSPLKPKVIKVCEYYLKGRCLKGVECTFSHDATPLTKSKACIHFARNNCMKGDACPYDHQLWKYPCDNFASQGFCNRGSSCLFSHEIPAKEDSQGVSCTEKLTLKSPPDPGDSSKNPVTSAAKIALKPPMQVPKGLNFLSFENSGSDKVRPGSSPEKVDLIGQRGHAMNVNHSSHYASGMVNILNMTSKPLAIPVTVSNSPSREAQSDHSVTKKNSIPEACSSKSMVDSTSPLDQALLGLSSLVPNKAVLNRFSNGFVGPSGNELIPHVHHLNGLGMDKRTSSPVEKENYGLKLDNRKGQVLKSKSQSLDKNHAKSPPAKLPTGVHLFPLDKSPMTEPSEKRNASITKDQEGSKKVSIHDMGKASVHGNPRNSSADILRNPVSLPSSSSSQVLGVNKNMPSSEQKSLFSTLSFASKLESVTKGYSLGSAENSLIQKHPENSSAKGNSMNSFNSQPVKASAILDFIFGSGGQKS